MQYVKVEIDEGKAYTYTWDGEDALQVGDWVFCPGNVVRAEEFVGKVIRLLDGPDPHYKGPYKAVLRVVL